MILSQTAEEIRERATEIVGRAEFSEAGRSLRERVADWLNERIASLLGAFIGGGLGSALAWALVVVGVVLIVLALSRLRGARPAFRPAAPQVETSAERSLSAAEWIARAEQAAEAGNWRLAVRCRYRGLVAELAERDVLVDTIATTSGEERSAVANAPFSHAADLFEMAWYGNVPQSEESARRIAELSDQALASAQGAGVSRGGSVLGGGAR